ncbi:Acid phosphatase [Beauveria bassiana]|nr:Acid phosphatase [Beauveria bassiana]KAH8709217.1 Acid phosphatase [Beauveria bassiana]
MARMKIAVTAVVGLLSALIEAVPTVDETYPYSGPEIPIGDWVNPTVKGNGKGYMRLVEPPAVKPASSNPTNNINVISLSYAGSTGVNIHYQTPFGLGSTPSVRWGTSRDALDQTAHGASHSYDRTPPCSEVAVTQCSQHYHDVQIKGLKPETTYYYFITAANGTTASDVLSFQTARPAGSKKSFTIGVLNDMGYTNAGGTYKQLNKAIDEGLAFAWHGGDISYADDWYSGIIPCQSSWPVCYNGSSTQLPSGITPDYDKPLPEGEIPTEGTPNGGDMSVLYESNWDLWQQWMTPITSKVPYMVLPGNHEAACAEFDGPGQILAAYLNHNRPNSTAPKSDKLTYYSCPPSQRNYTAYQHRFRMPGGESDGVSNFWYSFDYGLAHFISFNGETDYPNSPEASFARDIKGDEKAPKANETYITGSGPFGTVDGDITKKESYEQYKWLQNDLAKVNRTKTPWVIAMSHRPMYSSQVSGYQQHMRNAFEDLFLKYGVDAYLSGHIHWYERTFPLSRNGTIDKSAIINNNTFYANEGVSITHIINGMAGNIESHAELSKAKKPLGITAIFDQTHYGFSKLTVVNETVLTWSFVKGGDGSSGDDLTLIRKAANHSATSSAPSSTQSGAVAVITETVNSYTTYCPGPTTITEGTHTYVVSTATTLTISDCPCTRVVTSSGAGGNNAAPAQTSKAPPTSRAGQSSSARPVAPVTGAASASHQSVIVWCVGVSTLAALFF